MIDKQLTLALEQPSIRTLNGIVLDIMSRARVWYTPFEIIRAIKADHDVLISDSSCTARLRDLRKEKYGSHVIDKRKREGSNAYEYSLGEK